MRKGTFATTPLSPCILQREEEKEACGSEVTHPRSHTAGGRVWTEAQPLNSSILTASDKIFTVTLLFYLLFIPCLLFKRIGASISVIYFALNTI